MVLEVMGRHAGWLTGTSSYGFADMALIPEFEITKERKERFFEKVKEKYQENNYLIIAVSEGTRWYNDQTGQVEEVYASTETDEYGHPRLGGISGIIANEISQKLKIDARAQIIGYYARSGKCYDYDRKLTVALADKVLDLLLREDYGKMPVLKRIESFPYIEEYNTTAIDMGNIGNLPLPLDYYNPDEFEISEPYYDFLYHILGPIEKYEFKYKYPKVYPIK
jgi:6-phosphofructokinase 1